MLNLFIQGIAGHPHLPGALEILAPIFTMSISERKKKNQWYELPFFFSIGWLVFINKTTSTTKLCVVRVAGTKQDYSGDPGELYKRHPGYSRLHSKVFGAAACSSVRMHFGKERYGHEN